MRRLILTAGALLFLVVQIELVWLVRHNTYGQTTGQAPASGLHPGAGAKSWPIIDPDHPCGPVVLAMMGHLLDEPLTLDQANSLLHPDALGRVSMAELLGGFQQLGFSAQGVRLDPATCHQLEAPFVVYYGGNHFAVVVPKNASSLVLLNPPFQPETLTVETLQQRGWTGEGIVVGRSEERLEKLLARAGVSTL